MDISWKSKLFVCSYFISKTKEGFLNIFYQLLFFCCPLILQQSGVDRVEERYVHYNAGNGYTIEAGCLVRVQCGSGHCNFVEITEKWSKAIGSGSYTWDDFYTYANIEGTLKNTIRFKTRGNLEVATTESASAGFEAAGFTFGGSIGTTYHYRKTISFERTT